MSKKWLRKLISIGGRLNYLHRWAGTPMLNRQTVAEHSYNVTLRAHILGLIEENIYHNKVNWKNLFIKAYSHDLSEGLTGDIISPTKRLMKEEIDIIEEIMFNAEIGKVVPKELSKDIEVLFRGHKDNTIEGKITHAADLLDALEEILREYTIKDPAYDNTKDIIPASILNDTKVSGILTQLKDINLQSVNYYLEAYMSMENVEEDKQEGILKLGIDDTYTCKHCGHIFEKVENMTECPICKKSL